MTYDEYLRFFLSTEKREPFVIKKGSGKVMVSAPHSVEQTRKGKIKYAEYQTGILANMLHDSLDCHIVFKTCNLGDDANYDRFCKYKRSVCDFIRKNDVRYLIDLHQLASSRTLNIDIGTGQGRNIKKFPAFADMAAQAFRMQGITDVTINSIFDASYPYTVSSYTARHCKIPCLQIEINSRLVCAENEDFCFDKILTALSDIINELNKG